MLIIGPREAESNTVSLRVHREGDQGSIAVEAFLERATDADRTRALEA